MLAGHVNEKHWLRRCMKWWPTRESFLVNDVNRFTFGNNCVAVMIIQVLLIFVFQKIWICLRHLEITLEKWVVMEWHSVSNVYMDYRPIYVYWLEVEPFERSPFMRKRSGLKPGSHSRDFTGDHRRLDSRGVVAGWSAARFSNVAGVVVGGLLWSPAFSGRLWVLKCSKLSGDHRRPNFLSSVVVGQL